MTVSKKDLGSDLAKADGYVNDAEDYDEIPEATEEDFARGVVEVNGKPAKRGRPAAPETAKRQVTLRLDPDLLTAMRETGAGWQGRANTALRDAFIARKNSERGQPKQGEAQQVRNHQHDDRQAAFDKILVKKKK